MGGVRYKSQFSSLAGRKYIVNIHDDDFEGTAKEFCLGPDGFSLSYEGSTDDMYKPFIPGRLEFAFNVEDTTAEAFIIDLAQSEPNRFKMFITDGPASGDGTENLFWQGFVQGEGFSIADEYYPYEVSIAANDIGFFKEIDYVPASGESTIVDTLLAVLDQTGHFGFFDDGAHQFDELLVTTMNWWGVYMASGGDPSDKVGINERAWKDYDKANAPLFANCQDVVESICKLFGCRFFQSRGKFYLQQIDAVSDGTLVEHKYRTNKTLVSSNTVDKTVDVDRVTVFQMAGGSTSFSPGIKSVEREHKFTRNYLAGKSADQSAPLDISIGAVPVFNYIISGIAPKFQLKFKITYKCKNPIPSGLTIMHPVWRMRFYGVGATSGETWNYRQSALEFVELYAGPPSDIYRYWQEFRGPPYWDKSGWVTNTDSASPSYQPDRYFIDIYDTSAFGLLAGPGGTYYGVETTFEFAANIPQFGDPAGIAESIQELLISFDTYGIYTALASDDYTALYVNKDTDPSFIFSDYVDWKITEMELYLIGDEVESKIETGKKYKVESPTNFRKKTTADDCKLIAFDRRTLNSVLTWNGTSYTDSQLWQRGSWNITDSRSLNYLSIQEQLAHNRIGMRMYQGALAITDETAVGYDNIITKNSINYLPVQASFTARYDEWRNITMIEMNRDASGLTYSTVVSEGGSTGGAGSGSGVTGGYVVVGAGNVTGIQTEYQLPLYEFASGQSGSSYTIANFNLSGISGAPNGLVNQSLMVFQDATKLNYPMGYTIDFGTNELNFSYDLDNSVIEIYYYG